MPSSPAPPGAPAAVRFDVVCVGNALMDHIAFADAGVVAELGLDPGGMTLVDIATTERIEALVGTGEQVPGGTVTNTAVGIASLGGRPAFIGAVADDERGRRYADDLGRAGVHAALQHFAHDPGRAHDPERAHGPEGDEVATGRCFVVVTPDAERTMATALGVGGRLDSNGLDDEVIASSSLAYFDGYVLDLADAEALVARLVKVSRAAGTAVALGLSDAALVRRHHEHLAGLTRDVVDVLFANEAEAIALTGEPTLRGAVEALRRPGLVVAVTCGPAGALIATEEAVVAVPAEPVPRVVDKTGAGDLFAAGMCFGLTRGFEVERAARLGSLAAGEVIGHLGARPQVSLAELARSRGLL